MLLMLSLSLSRGVDEALQTSINPQRSWMNKMVQVSKPRHPSQAKPKEEEIYEIDTVSIKWFAVSLFRFSRSNFQLFFRHEIPSKSKSIDRFNQSLSSRRSTRVSLPWSPSRALEKRKVFGKTSTTSSFIYLVSWLFFFFYITSNNFARWRKPSKSNNCIKKIAVDVVIVGVFICYKFTHLIKRPRDEFWKAGNLFIASDLI